MTNNNMNERFTALVDSYGDDANWRPSNDGCCFSFAFGGHGVMAFYVPNDLPWVDDEPYWGWVVEPGDGRGNLAHDVRLTTAAEAKADAFPAIVRIVRSEGTPEADAERAKAEAKRARLVTIECCEAMLGLAPAERTHVIDALRDWAAAADKGPSDMTTEPPRPIDATPRSGDD